MSEIKTNKISSLDSSNSDITLDPDGTGDVVVASGHDLTVDTNTLHVDATNNRVGIGTVTPDSDLKIKSTGAAILRIDGGAVAPSVGPLIVGEHNDADAFYIGTNSVVLGESSNQDVVIYGADSSSGNIRFYAGASTETARIRDGGGITFNGDTAAANALDDYEEGTWTPVLRAETSNLTATYIEQVGRYVRVGKLVHVQSRMQGSVTNAGVGARFIDGLPYTNVNAAADTGSGSVAPFNGFMGNNYYFATGHGVNNEASFRLKIQTGLDGNLSDVSSGTGGFAIDFSYTYRSQS